MRRIFRKGRPTEFYSDRCFSVDVGRIFLISYLYVQLMMLWVVIAYSFETLAVFLRKSQKRQARRHLANEMKRATA